MRYETIFFAVGAVLGEPENAEPAKCAGWAWVPLDDLPPDRFAIDGATIDAIRAYADAHVRSEHAVPHAGRGESSPA